MTEMALIVPSRGRPENIVRLYDALHKTNADVELVVGVDADDPRIDDYYEIVNNRNFTLVVSPERRRFGATLNSLALRFADDYKYLAWCGDDHLPITPEWDRFYREELEKMDAGIVYGNDLVQGINIPTQMGFTSNIVKALGYAVPQGFIHLYIDNYFLDLGRALDGAAYLPDVIVQHLHPSAGAAQEDQTYREANSPENWSNDQKRYADYVINELDKDVEKIKKYASKNKK
jgi:hypothetical protein